ncbi:hypothetical protein FQN51_002941 [Onygenales sp. PD_10]|nr:hypothetical protein FQN51_002941 [Onygenales sp. PD_10]
MRASFFWILFLSTVIIGVAYADVIEVGPRQETGEPNSLPTKASPTTDVLSKTISSTVSRASESASEAHVTSKEVPTSVQTGNPTTTTATSVPSEFAYLNGTLPRNPNVLPLAPKITPALSVAGVFLILAGGVYTLIGIRNQWVQISLSAAFLSALAVTILIVYLLQPPISNAVQGAFFVASLVSGLIVGSLCLAFQEVTEGLGCILGGFCLSMFILSTKPGGLIVNPGGKAGFIVGLSAASYTTSFSRHTRPYGLIGSSSFSGATAVVLGIDCFSRSGLKEFWLYIWGILDPSVFIFERNANCDPIDLNEDIFPLNTNTYPITRGIRVQLAVIVLIFLMGVISQVKIWKVIKERREKQAAQEEEEQKKRDEIEEQIARSLEEGTNRARIRWEAVYGHERRPPTDSSTMIEQPDMHRSFRDGADHTALVGQDEVYEMEAFREPEGDCADNTRPTTGDSDRPFLSTTEAMPAPSDTAVSSGPLDDALVVTVNATTEDDNRVQEVSELTTLHELPTETETPAPIEIAAHPPQSNPFQGEMDDCSSSVGASVADSEYIAGVRSSIDSGTSTQRTVTAQEAEVERDPPQYDDGLGYREETRSLTSSIAVEPNEEFDYGSETTSREESDTRNTSSSAYSETGGEAASTTLSDHGSVASVKATRHNDGKPGAPTPIVTIEVTVCTPEERSPIERPEESDGQNISLANREPSVQHQSEIAVAGTESELPNVQPTDANGKDDSIREDSDSIHPTSDAVPAPITEVQVSDDQTPKVKNGFRDTLESVSPSVPNSSAKASKRISTLQVRSSLTSESVENIPCHTSKVILSYRTNEWAKHVSDAEPPVSKEDDVPMEQELEEPVAPVLVDELQKTAVSNLNPQKAETVNYIDPKPHNGESLRPTSSSSRVSYTGTHQLNNARGSTSSVKLYNYSDQPQTSLTVLSNRPASASSPNLPGQLDINKSRPNSSLVAAYRSSTCIPEVDETDESHHREIRMSSAPLIAQRELAIQNRSSLLHLTNHSTPSFDRTKSQLSLAPTTISIPQYQNTVEADDLPLSMRRELLHQDMYPRPQSSIRSMTSLDNISLSTLRQPTPSRNGASVALTEQSREAKLARWRESLKEEIAMEHLPGMAVDMRRADLIKEKQWSHQGKQQQAIAASYRQSMIDRKMREGNLQDLHTEAMRRMQAAANRHVR